MKEKLQIFKNEEFGKIGATVINGDIYFTGNEISKMLGYKNYRNAVSTKVDDEDKLSTQIEYAGQNRKMTLINESGLYSLILSSKLPSAKKFKRWVTSEVLPTIRKTGGYVADDDLFINTYLPNADEQTKLMFKSNLMVITNLNTQLDKANNEIKYKEDVIIGLVDDVDLATKRQRLNQIMRRGFSSGGAMSNKWGLLYGEFERKYHININSRMKNEDVKTMKPKIKNKIDYIDRVMGKIPELYELACKLFENDVEALKSEWFDVVNK